MLAEPPCLLKAKAALRVRARHDGVGLGKLAQPVRVAVTGSAASPGIFETLTLLGRERSVARLERAVAELPAS